MSPQQPNRATGPKTPAPRPTNQIHVVGQGVVVPAKADLPVSGRSFELDIVDLTPNDPLSLKAGTYAVHVRQADVAVPAKTIEGLITQELRKQGVQDARVSFQAPDKAVVSGRIKNGQEWAPIQATMRLGAEGGKLTVRPLSAAISIEGFDIAAQPQAKKAQLTTTDQNLLGLLKKDLAKVDELADVNWAFKPGNRVEASAKLILSKVPGELRVVAGVQPSADGKLEIIARQANLSWRGLEIEAQPDQERATVQTTEAAVTKLIEEELDLKAVRGIQLKFKPGGRFVVTGEVMQDKAFRPVEISGHIEAHSGALRVVPERATVRGILGGIDVVAKPQTAQAEADISDAVINRLVGPIVAKEHFADFQLTLQPGNRFTLTGVKTDPKDPTSRKPVKIEGDMALQDAETVKMTFRKIKYGKISVDFGDLHVKFLNLLGFHLDDVLKINEPFLQLKKDALYLQPGKLTDKVQGELEGLSTSAGKLSVKTKLLTPVDQLLPFKQNDRFRTDGKAIYITPNTFTNDLAGTITGFETGEGTAKASLKLTGKDLQHIVPINEAGIDWHGNRVVLDLNTLQDYAQGDIRALRTGEGTITAELDADPAQALKRLPTLPAGLDVNGQRVAIAPEAINANYHGEITGVTVEGGQLRLKVGTPAVTGSGNRIEATTKGALLVEGIRVENAQLTLSDATPDTPLDPTRFAQENLTIARGQAFIPREKIEAVLAEKLAPKAPKGAEVRYVEDGLAVKATWKGIPLSGQLAVSAAGADGLGVTPKQVKLGPVPVPGWLATRLVGWLAKMPVSDGRVMVDLGKALGVKLGPVDGLEVTNGGIAVSIGGERK